MGASKPKMNYADMSAYNMNLGKKVYSPDTKMPQFSTEPPKIDYKGSGSKPSWQDAANAAARGLAPLAGRRKAGDTFGAANQRNYERLVGGGSATDTGEGVSVIQPGAPMMPMMPGYMQAQGGQGEKSTGQRIAGGAMGALSGAATGSAFGPVGTVVGGALGGLGGLFG